MLECEQHNSVSRQFPPAAVFGLLAIILVCSQRAVLNDGDTYTHIAAGHWMVDHRAVLTWDPFSATFNGQPWQAHEWLSEVFLGLAHRMAGLTGVVVLTAAAVAIAFGNLARHIGRWCGWRETMLLTTAALVCVIPCILARPHMLALPLLEVWVAGLLNARVEGRVPTWWLLPLMVIWANLHGGFAFGLCAGVAFAVEASWERIGRRALLWWGFVMAAFGSALLTPQGWHGLLFPIGLLQLHSLGAIKEWQPTQLSAAIGFDGVVLGLVILLASGRVQMSFLRAALLVGLLYLALAHTRHLVLFGIAGSLILAEPVGRAFPNARAGLVGRRGRAICWSGVALVAALRLGNPVADVDGLAAPVSALAQLPAEVAKGNVLNSSQFGGYLTLAGLHPFIDGRAELFGDAFDEEYLAMSTNGGLLQRSVDQYGITWALLAVDDPLVDKFDGMTGWQRQYADRLSVVFVRTLAQTYP